MNDKEVEKILHACVKTECGQLIIGKHHGDCFHKGINIGYKMSKNREAQGFITNKARFLDRKEGAEIAFTNGQIDEPTSMLFSEHMWSNRYKAKHEYDEVRGYVLRSTAEKSALNLQSGNLAERLQELEKEFYEDSDEFEYLKDIRGIECYVEVEDE